MAPDVLAATGGETTHSADTSGLRYVARQPILDLRGRVHGYELLFRSGAEEFFQGDGDLATRTMLDNTLMYGLAKLTGGLPAFVNCTSDSLTDDLVQALPSSMTVLEILENVEPTPSLIGACRMLKAAGFRLALDDFTWKPELQPLLHLADYIKVDFCLTDAASRRELFRQLNPITVALVAEKVETQEEYFEARAQGFSLFQGYYFWPARAAEEPEGPGQPAVADRDTQSAARGLIRCNQNDPSGQARRVPDLSPPTADQLACLRASRPGPSVQAALMAVGEDTFRRIAVLAITSEFNSGQPPELLRMAFVRGKFCEFAAGLCALDSTEQYLLGMLSLLPAMLQVPIEELTPALALRDEIRRALEGKPDSERKSCAMASSAHEQGIGHEDCGSSQLGYRRQEHSL